MRDTIRPAAPAAASDDDVRETEKVFTVADLVALIRAQRRLILRVAVAVVMLTVLLLMMLPTGWTATAVVLLDQRKNAVADASSVLSTLPTDPASMQNQIQILTSRDLAGEVIDKYHLMQDAEFNPAKSHGLFSTLPDIHTLINPLKWFKATPPAGTQAARDAAREKVIDNVLAGLSVDTVGLSTSIAVRYRAHSAAKSAELANAFASTYVEQQIHIKAAAARQATQWLSARVAQLADQVQAADTAVEQYKADHNLSEGADGTSLTTQQLNAINTQLVQARADLAAKEATYSRVKALIASGHVADVSQVVSSPLIVQLRTQESTLLQQEADLATKYGPLHPKLVAVRNQRRDLENKLKEEVNRIAGSLQNDVAVARAQVASLNASLKGTEKDAAEQSLATVKLKALQADAASTRSMYEAFVTRLRQTQDQEAFQISDARVISPAPVPNAPSSPHRTVIFAAALPAALLLGLFAALLAERFGMVVPATSSVNGQTGIARRRRAQARREPAPKPAAAPQPKPFTPVPVLGRIRDASTIRAVDYVIDWPQSEFAQGLDGLMRAIALPAQGERPRVVAVTAATAEQGKTAIALGLARTAARAGWKAILVDGDLKRAPSARTLGYSRAEPGLVDAMRNQAPLSRCFLKDPRSSLLALANLSAIANPFGTLASPVMGKLLAHLRQSADLVIIDAPPLSVPRECHALVRQSDAVLLVADARRMSEEAVQTEAETLSRMHAPSIGIVFAG